jgi:predicted nucleic acid-binding protein
MRYLADSNVLLRLMHRNSALNPLVRTAFKTLGKRADEICITPQNLIEFWGVATRPVNVNGFALPQGTVLRHLLKLEALFSLLPDTQNIYLEWRNLVHAVGVTGKQVHDARLVAVMRVYGITHILTFNAADFSRYPGITVVHPQDA